MQNSTNLYRIVIKGHLSKEWVDWQCELDHVQNFNGETQQPVTILTVALPDQSALHGLLDKIRDLNLTLISINPVKH